MADSFHFDSDLFSKTLGEIERVREDRVAIVGKTGQNLSVGVGLYAETLAARVGVVPGIPLSNGDVGVFDVGAAAGYPRRWEKVDPGAETLYYGALNSIRTAGSSVRLIGSGGAEVQPMGNLLLYLSVVGVVAAYGLAVWRIGAEATNQFEIEKKHLIQLADVNNRVKIAQAQLSKGQKIDPELVKPYVDKSEKEKSFVEDLVGKGSDSAAKTWANSVTIPYLIGGAALCAFGGALLFSRASR